MTTQTERLVRVEEQVNSLKSEFAELKTDVAKMNQKLDELLALKYKGAGAFWLVSTLIGTGIIGALIQLLAWWKGN